MNNILGQPVEGSDFYDREEDTKRIWLSLEEGNHILLLAPRRVGKTSLAIRVGSEFSPSSPTRITMTCRVSSLRRLVNSSVTATY